MALPFFGRLMRNLLYGFRRELRAYESAVLERVLIASIPKDQEALRQQFESRERVQRWAERVLYFGLPPQHQLPRIASMAPDYCYAAVKLAAPTGNVTAKLMTHRGILSTIEFSKAPVPVLSGEFSILQVKLHPGGTGYTEEIHESEHDPRDNA